MNHESQSAPSNAPSSTNAPLLLGNDETTGLSWFPTWRRVYWLVLIVFVVYVLLLSALSRVYA